MVAPVSDKSFLSDVLQSKEPVLVDFWAEWCGPCRAVGPVLEEVAGELQGKLKVVKLNVDENPETAAKYGIQSIPTLMIFKNGEMASRQIGASPKAKIVQWINGAVA
jgi:thioredoxin 1